MQNLKNKIILELSKELYEEANSHIHQMENEREKVLEVIKKRKIKPFSHFKINYYNFKDGYIGKCGFFFSNLKDFWPIFATMFSAFLINSSCLPDKFFFFVLTSLLTSFPFFLSKNFKRRLNYEEKVEEINEKIETVRWKLSHNISNDLRKFVYKPQSFNKNDCFNIENLKGKKVNIYDRPVRMEIIKEIAKNFSEEEIVRLMQKSKDGQIRYGDLIELIVELDNNDNAIKNYNKIFSFSSKLNKEDKIKEKELVF